MTRVQMKLHPLFGVSAAALAVLLLAVLLAACGGGAQEASSPASPAAALDKAANNMEAAGSLRYTLKVSMLSRDMSNRPIPFTGEGVAAINEERGRMTLDLAKMFEIAIAQEAGPGERKFIEMLFGDRKGWKADMRYIGNTGWMRIPALTELVGGKPWIKLEDGNEPESGLDVALGDSPNNPATLLPYLRSLGPVKEVGKEQVHGLATTHYHATVELERVPDQAPADKRDELRKRIERTIEQTGQRTVPIEVWVDENALPRRLRFVDVSPPAKDEKYPTTYRATMEILEYNVTVDVVSPPARKVMSEAEFDRLMA